MDPQEISLEALMKINYGLYVISSKSGDEINGLIANAITQTSAEPPTIAVCINKDHLTHEFIKDSAVLSISILAEETPMKFIGRFGFRKGREINKFEGLDYKYGVTGAPILLEHTVATIECEVIDSVVVETHTLFISKIVNSEMINDKTPMTYDYYYQVLKGKSPKSAPTYLNSKKK
ncbi:flavin reductase family protein [Orenia marismortui]|uniref:Flavin reductase (DIM6/NTAB) family NADH-FMN oxidoreductase RutF n=1 Tax=Orenia marismortui TaxID=46469 RepID=A0A4R8H171_9FIRM|nr:flavin reductase family protein [Orenia marismortui]TDX53184.1 flavin reductase (DIM6/NTAB) family NADH-FMN oxidoreductase RutF [Orenia marismortui]